MDNVPINNAVNMKSMITEWEALYLELFFEEC